MTRIRVEPSSLRHLSSRFRYEMFVLGAIEGRLNGAVSTLDWETRSEYGISTSWNSARGRSRSATSLGNSLSDQLLNAATRFEQADHGSADALSRIFYQERVELPLSCFLPSQKISEVLGLEADAWRKFVACVLPALTGATVTVGLLGITERILGDKESRGHVLELCLNAIGRLKPGLLSVPVIGLVAGTFLDFVDGGDLSRRGFQIAASKNGIELAICANPIMAGVLAGNSVVQLGGSAMIWGPERLAQGLNITPMQNSMLENSAFRTSATLKKLDLGNITGDLGRMVNDSLVEPRVNASRDFFGNPSVGNFSKLMAPTLLGPFGGIGQAMVNQQSRSLLWQDTKAFAGNIADFAVGSQQMTLELARHGATVAGVASSSVAGQVLPTGIADQVKNTSTEILNRVNSIPTIPSFGTSGR